MLSNINIKFVVFRYSRQEVLLPECLQEEEEKGSSNAEKYSA